MLAIINPNGWNADQSGSSSVPNNNQTRAFNFLAALHSLATCAAGATPTAVNPVNANNSTKDTSSNCIKLLSNTEAGGWTAGASNNITAATTYNASAGSLFVDLYRDSGKSTYPWYRYTIGTYTYPFSSGNFSSYPQLEIWGGSSGSSSLNPATTALTSDGNYNSGVTSFVRGTTNWTSNAYNQVLNIGAGYTEIYVAVTANYLIISQANQMAYYGIRNQAGWELSRTDNPAWATFGFCGDAGSAYHVVGNYQHTEWCWAWMAGINNSGVVSGPSKRGAQKNYETGINVITGQQYNSAQGNNQFNSPNSGYLRPLFPMGYPSQYYVGYGWAPEAPVTDPVTGLTVPPAYPIVYNYSDGSTTCSGQVPGIYKGMSADSTGLNTYVTANEYVIDGQAYVPVKTAHPSYPELFFLRKA